MHGTNTHMRRWRASFSFSPSALSVCLPVAKEALIYSNHLTASDNRIIAPLNNIHSGQSAGSEANRHRRRHAQESEKTADEDSHAASLGGSRIGGRKEEAGNGSCDATHGLFVLQWQ